MGEPAVDVEDLMADLDGACVQVHVTPAQPARLAAAQTQPSNVSRLLPEQILAAVDRVEPAVHELRRVTQVVQPCSGDKQTPLLPRQHQRNAGGPSRHSLHV